MAPTETLGVGAQPTLADRIAWRRLDTLIRLMRWRVCREAVYLAWRLPPSRLVDFTEDAWNLEIERGGGFRSRHDQRSAYLHLRSAGLTA